MFRSNSPASKRKSATATLLSTLLITALTGTLFVNLATANAMFFPPPEAPPLVVTVQLPETKVYTKTSVPVAFTIQRSYKVQDSTFISGFKFYVEEKPECSYFLDGKEILLETIVSADSDYYVYTATLSRLSKGLHKLVIFANYNYYVGMTQGGGKYHRPTSGISDTVVFTVGDATLHVLVSSPITAKTYNTTTLPLTFSVSKPASWLGYSLDGEAPVTITENTTLSNLSEGTHIIVVQAKDASGATGVSKPITFKVEKQEVTQPTKPQTAPFPTTLVAIATIASATVASFGLLAYFVKIRKRKYCVSPFCIVNFKYNCGNIAFRLSGVP